MANIEFKEIVGDFILEVHANSSPQWVIIVNGLRGGAGVIGDLEFKKLRKKANTLHITDMRKTWGNSPDLHRLVGRLDTILPKGQHLFMGNSMGGFYAFLLASFFEGSRVLAFAPQFSVDPSIVPNENRWREHTAQLEFHVQSLSGRLKRPQWFLTVFGDEAKERIHSALFIKEMFLLETNGLVVEVVGQNHSVARHLKSLGLIGSLISASLAEDTAKAVQNFISSCLSKGVETNIYPHL